MGGKESSATVRRPQPTEWPTGAAGPGHFQEAAGVAWGDGGCGIHPSPARGHSDSFSTRCFAFLGFHLLLFITKMSFSL